MFLVYFMKKIIILLLVIFLLFGCMNTKTINIPVNSSTELIKDYGQTLNNADDAKQLFQLWLNYNTDFNPVSNKIEAVDTYSDYYTARLTSAINITGRETGVLGYRDYKFTKDGKLYGYYYSK